jgi:hypothetical protein
MELIIVLQAVVILFLSYKLYWYWKFYKSYINLNNWKKKEKRITELSKTKGTKDSIVKNKAIEALSRKEAALKLVVSLQQSEKNLSVLKDLEKNEIEIRAEISLLRHLLDIL